MKRFILFIKVHSLLHSNAPEEEELIIPLVQTDRAASFKAKAKEKMLAKKKPIETQDTKTEGKEPLSLDAQAEKALIDGEIAEIPLVVILLAINPL